MQEIAACIVQRTFRTSQIKRAIKILNYKKEIVEEHSFEEFTKKIQDKHVLKLVNYILTKITRISKYGAPNLLTSQDFLSAFVIYGYKDDIINPPEVISSQYDINKILIKNVKVIVENFDSFLSIDFDSKKIEQFSELLYQYKTIFDLWKTKDKQKLIHILTTTYYEINDVINEVENEHENEDENEVENEVENEDENEDENEVNFSEEKVQYINICKKRQEDIINKVLYLNGQEYFNNYKPEVITFDDSIKQQIKETLHTAFWDMLHNDLASEPPEYDKLIILLTELRNTFCSMVPNRHDIQEEIHENIDIDLIKNMITHNAFDDVNLQKLAIYIISLVKKFQPQVMDDDVNKWEQGVLKQFKHKFQYADFLVVFLRSIFNMLEGITFSAKKFLEEHKDYLDNQENQKI